MLRTIYLGMSANFFGQAVTVAIQLLSLPMFLHFWTTSRYGEWLLLSAVPAYFSMADIGIVAVGMNKMTMLAAESNWDHAERTFQSILLLTTIAIFVVATTTFVAIWLCDVGGVGEKPEWRAVLSMLILASLANIFSGLFDAVFRSSGQYALGVYALNIARLVEWLGSLAGLICGGSLATVAAGLLLGRLLANFALWFFVIVRFPQYRWGFAKASKQELSTMLLPAASFMALPLGNAISIQGTSLLVGSFFGPVALAVFNSYRTMSRVAVQLVTMLSRVLWPEISKLYGRRAVSGIRSLYRWGTLATATASAATAISIYVLSPAILTWWTHGRIAQNGGLAIAFLLVTSLTGFWQVGMVVLMAVNKHQQLAAIYLGASVVSIIGSACIAGRLGVEGAAASLLFIEISMLFATSLSVRSFFSREGTGV